MTKPANNGLNDKRGRGRPPTNIDYDEVYRLGLIHCTIAECAVLLDCPEPTLQGNKEFQRVYKKGQEQGKKSLRRLQFAKAEGQEAKILKDKDGNPILDDKKRPVILQPGYAPDTTMQIWLGKQQLGQVDNQTVSLHTEKPVEVIIKNYEKEETKNG